MSTGIAIAGSVCRMTDAGDITNLDGSNVTKTRLTEIFKKHSSMFEGEVGLHADDDSGPLALENASLPCLRMNRHKPNDVRAE